MVYSFADFKIEYDFIYGKFKKLYTDYISTPPIDLSVKVTSEDLDYEERISEEKVSKPILELTAFYRKIADWLPLHDAFVLHSATFDVDGTGVAFAAHSGTGKSTHMLLWQKYLGERFTIINGDKPIVRFFENEPDIPYAYGNPWCGKERLSTNKRTVLKHICFIERSETNYVEKISKSDAVNRIFNQVYMPKYPVAVMNTLKLIDRLLSSCDLWIIHCNMEEDSAKTAYEAIFKK